MEFGAATALRVDSGELQGAVEDGVVSYKGIPFAAPVVELAAGRR